MPVLVLNLLKALGAYLARPAVLRLAVRLLHEAAVKSGNAQLHEAVHVVADIVGAPLPKVAHKTVPAPAADEQKGLD